MSSYRLSARAERQLLEIYISTDEAFGSLQADAYHAGFEKLFELIAASPGIGRSADEIKNGYRRYRHQAHYIFYTIHQNHIRVEAILHTSRDLRADLFD